MVATVGSTGSSLLVRVHPRTGTWRSAAAIGLYAGVLSAFVKLGWEVLLPPRTGGRVEPPLLMLNKIGLPADGWTFTFSGQPVSWASLLVHFVFSVVTVVVYCVVAEHLPGITLGVGTVYGIGVFVVFHLVVLPALGLSPAAWNLPLEEWVSEGLGHAVWLLAAELIRRGAGRPVRALPTTGGTVS